MAGRDKPPQTIAEARSWGYRWVRARCSLCRHEGRVQLGDKPGPMKLSAIGERLWCPQCRRRVGVDAWIGWTGENGRDYEKQVELGPGEVRRIGMG